MKTILSSRRHHYVKRLGIFLIMVALIVGIAGFGGSCGCAPVQYDLTTSSTEGGEVIIGEGTYADETVVTLEAVADECYEFVSWTGADVADPYSAITTVTMDEAKSIIANFALLSYDLTTDSTDGGAVTSPGEDIFTYDCGTVVPLVAAAEEGYYFVNWTGDVDTIANINGPTTTITMMGDYSITANFELIPPGQFVLTTSSTAGGSVITPGEGTSPYDEGTVVDLVAEAEECYEFINWTGDTVADPGSATTNITMDGAKNVTANFALLSYNLTADSTDGGNVTAPGEDTFPYDCGTVVDLVAAAELGYHFVEWTGDFGAIADVYAASTNITMSGDYSITANFGPFSGGNGTAGDPYQLADWYNLDNVRNYLSSYFILTNDLDFSSIGYTELASETANEGKGWQPVGTTAENDKFAGNFDGQGYEICDLFIDRPDEYQVGLFGVVDEVGAIENVGVVNGNVTGKDDVGGLVGKNEGTVSNSYSTGSVTGRNRVGGLVGRNEGTVSNSYSTGSVTGHDDVGGLVGKNEGTASDAYSTGSVTGNNRVGGLVGKNSDAVSNSFWDTETSGMEGSAGGTGKTTEEMMDIATFTGAAWNITAVDPGETNPTYTWNIVDTVSYPFLSWQPV